MDNINVLLVEDESVLAMVIRETLTPLGFDITIAANGVEGWSLFHSVKPDICVVDIMMPRKDGLSLVADIRQVDELIPITTEISAAGPAGRDRQYPRSGL